VAQRAIARVDVDALHLGRIRVLLEPVTVSPISSIEPTSRPSSVIASASRRTDASSATSAKSPYSFNQDRRIFTSSSAQNCAMKRMSLVYMSRMSAT
jgi:hypothetical protein